MKITGATTPPDFRNLVVIEQDRDFSAGYPKAAFWHLPRVRREHPGLSGKAQHLNSCHGA